MQGKRLGRKLRDLTAAATKGQKLLGFTAQLGARYLHDLRTHRNRFDNLIPDDMGFPLGVKVRELSHSECFQH